MNTPNNKLRFGLSRPSGSIKKRSSILNSSSSNTPTSSLTTPLASTTTPQASVVIKNTSISSSSTPKTSLPSKFKKSLITKKKLEFAAHKHLESDKPLEDDEAPTNIEDLDIESLTLLVEEKRSKLEVLKRHQAEKQELTDLIERWKDAGLAALDQLRKFSQEPKTNEQILDSFKIPHDAFL